MTSEYVLFRFGLKRAFKMLYWAIARKLLPLHLAPWLGTLVLHGPGYVGPQFVGGM